jgi:hypothetical protein
VPAPHFSHEPAPAAALKVPAPQLRHVDEPVAVWNLPASQLVHASDISFEEKVPAAHGRQTWAPLYSPSLHTTAVHTLAPGADRVQVAHAEQAEAPAAEY